MRTAISNIAWNADEETMAAALLQQYQVAGVEIAPTKIWPDPLAATVADLRAYRRFWEAREITVVALQSLLFGHPELTIFDTVEARQKTANYLRRMIGLGGELGARALVFGSPKNRLRGALPVEQAWTIAVAFFHDLGSYATECGVVLCIEPNPPQYGCDFMTLSSEAQALVRDVDSPGFGLHLDAAILGLSGEDADAALTRCALDMVHFHVSEPYLEPVGTGGVDHATVAAALRRSGYHGWASVEMRRPEGDVQGQLRLALQTLATYYQS